MTLEELYTEAVNKNACKIGLRWLREQINNGENWTIFVSKEAMSYGYYSWVEMYIPSHELPEPNDQDRQTAIEEGYAYFYAKDVDECPRNDTREAAIEEGHAYHYARDVDKRPRNDTREAAIEEGYAYHYARDVDKRPRNDTRKAAAFNEGYAYEYSRFENDGEIPENRTALIL